MTKDIARLALVGNPNSGKTTLFNSLTGLAQHTSNYHGTTVEICGGRVRHCERWQVLDTPGAYSLSSHTADEAVTRDLLTSEKFDLIAVVIDPAHLLRGLAFALELLDQHLPLALIINVAQGQVVRPDLAARLTEIFALPTLVIDAAKKKNLTELHELLLSHRSIPIDSTLLKKIHPQGVPATKIESRRERILWLEKNCGDLAAALHPRTAWLDHILTHQFFGLPIFFGLMWLSFELVFRLSEAPTGWIETAITACTEWIKSLGGASWWLLTVDGVIGGVGATAVFVPQIVLLFVLLGVLEQSGYLARAAFVLERYLVRFGIHGKSAVALLMGFGCNVPALLALRTLPTMKEKLLTAAMIPFMSCSARLPVFAVLSAAFVAPAWRGVTLFGLYLLGILVALATAWLGQRLLTGRSQPLLLELPEYRIPRPINLVAAATRAVRHFLVRAGRIIVPVSIILIALFSLPLHAPASETYAAQIGDTLTPAFAPLGFDSRVVTGLVAGIAAKEVYVATLGTLYALESSDETGLIAHLQADPVFTPDVVAASFVFILLYTPCLAVIATLRQEFGWAVALGGVLYPTLVAWLAALATRLLTLQLLQ